MVQIADALVAAGMARTRGDALERLQAIVDDSQPTVELMVSDPQPPAGPNRHERRCEEALARTARRRQQNQHR